MKKRTLSRRAMLPTLVFAMLFVAISCSDDSPTVTDQNFTVRVKNGYLEFKDDQTFQQIRSDFKTLSQKDVANWEAKFSGFVSQRSLYEKAIDEETRFYESKEAVLLGKNHSPFVEQHSDLFIFDDEGVFELNLPYTEEMISYFVNKDGLLKVGTKLYQYSRNSIKVIVDGDERKLKLLPEISLSSKEHGVLVYNITYKAIVLGSSANGKTDFSGNANCTDYTSGGGQRVKGKIYEGCTAFVDYKGDYGYPGEVVTQTTITTSATNEIKGVFGWSGKRTTQLRIEGTVEIVAPYGSGTYSVYKDTGGELTNYIQEVIWTSSWYPQQCGTIGISFYGTLDFYGRDGTNCQI
jgi:hypothetical protein